MVLSPSALDDESRPRQSGWIEQVKLGLRLSGAGILIHVDHARPERLGQLVQGLVADHPELDVHTDVHAAETAPEGSVMVLIPKAEDAEWLNLRRPIFAERALKVVLFCDRETTLALADRAVDFFDWVSQHHDCPPGPALHAVLGLQCAVAAEAPGILWTGSEDQAGVGGMWNAFSAAFPGEQLQWILPERDYEEIVADIRAAATGWVACRIRAETHLRRLRWALAEAGRRTRAIAVTSAYSSPGWWPVHDRMVPLEEARRLLQEAGATRPGCLAALAGLEPEAVELARVLLRHGMQHSDFVGLLRSAADPGVVLATEACDEQLIDLDAVARRQSPPPVLRALDGDSEVRELRIEQIARVRELLAKGEHVPAEDVGFAAAMDTTPLRIKKLFQDGTPSAFIVESKLRENPDAMGWAHLARLAFFHVGETEASSVWALRSIEQSGRILDGPVVEHLRTQKTRRGKLLDDADFESEIAGSKRFPVELLLMFIPQVPITFVLRYFSIREPGTAGIILRGILFILSMIAVECLTPRPRISIQRDEQAPKRAQSVNGCGRDLAEKLEKAIEKSERCHYLDAKQSIFELRTSLQQAQLDAEHPLSRRMALALASIHVDLREDAAALPVLLEAIPIEGRLSGVHHASFAALMVELAVLLHRKGAAREAEALLEKALAPERLSNLPGLELVSSMPPELTKTGSSTADEFIQFFLSQPAAPERLAPETRARALRALAEVLLAQGRYGEAEIIARKAHTDATEGPPAARPEQWRSLSILGRAMALQGRFNEGKEALQTALQRATDAFGKHHLETARLLLDLARMQARHGDPAAATTASRAMTVYAQAEGTPEERDEALKELGRIAESAGAHGHET